MELATIARELDQAEQSVLAQTVSEVVGFMAEYSCIVTVIVGEHGRLWLLLGAG